MSHPAVNGRKQVGVSREFRYPREHDVSPSGDRHSRRFRATQGNPSAAQDVSAIPTKAVS